MIKYFCDGCGKELDPKEAGKRLEGKMERVTVTVMASVDGVFNGGLVCHDCLRKIIASTKPIIDASTGGQ